MEEFEDASLLAEEADAATVPAVATRPTGGAIGGDRISMQATSGAGGQPSGAESQGMMRAEEPEDNIVRTRTYGKGGVVEWKGCGGMRSLVQI